MTKINDLLQEKAIHSIRSDGSKMIALKTGSDTEFPEWEIFTIEKDGQVNNDGMIILPPSDKAVLRKTVGTEQLQERANIHDFVEWQTGFLKENDNEQAFVLNDKIRQTEEILQQTYIQKEEIEKQLQEAQKRVKELQGLAATQKKREKSVASINLEEVEQRIKSTAAAIAERTPSHTQKIIANQVELGAGYYEQVGAQSHESFRLSLWLAVAGAAIFFFTVFCTVLITLFRGDTTLIVIIGSCAAGLTEVLAALNRLYNQASQQFADFQVYLDRINRSSICYSMISEEEFEKKTEKQQEEIIKIIETLLQQK